eukprot:3342004-Rhodomonas_salina.1
MAPSVVRPGACKSITFMLGMLAAQLHCALLVAGNTHNASIVQRGICTHTLKRQQSSPHPTQAPTSG